jgi:Replication initiator protein, pSAM2
MHRHSGPPRHPADQLTDLPIREHARSLIAECLRLSKLPGLEGLRLAAWAHMLGFRGHFSTKSRTYSITLGALRADRAAYQREQAIAAGLMPDLAPDSTLVLTQWHFAGRGYPLIAPPGPLTPLAGGQRDGSHREGVDDVA